ncbi:hypothetical protein CRI93_03280 [Longimonas halophila]|uniref:Uncharacterized protein n=2 Tax=Longimonas halophila TaxID=1469170 RepID=A0A2H3P0A3_9BACT|nr:hypothetical protein CRI93_03280 [Longimonas halophila]
MSMLTHTRNLPAVGLLLLATALFLTGCDLFGSDDGSAVDVGIVEWETDASNNASAQTYSASGEPYTEDFEPLTAPDTVQVGESFEVEVRTVAANGCYEADRVETERDALLIEITPYDRDPTDAETACPHVIGLLKRTLNLQFDTPGDALIRLNGQRVIGNDFSNRDDTVIEHDVVVVE